MKNILGHSGVSIIELAIVLILGAMTLLGVTAFVKQTSWVSERVGWTSELIGLRAKFRGVLNCQQTKVSASVACAFVTGNPAANEFLAVKNKSGSVLIDTSQNQTIGNYRLRARCPLVDGSRKIVIEVMKLNKAGVATLDPDTKLPMMWTPLFQVPLCDGA